jgi:hypothetical protein
MMVLAFIQWWYGLGWAEQGRSINRRVTAIARSFSVGIIIRTLFAPWKQMITSTSRTSSLEYRFRAAVDNLVSRTVGFVVRSLVLLTAVILMGLVGAASIIGVVLWPVAPILPLMLLIISAVGKIW